MKRKVLLLMVMMAVVLTSVSEGALITPAGWKHSNANSSLRAASMLGNAAGMDAAETVLYNQYAPLATGETTGADGKEFVTTSQTGPGWVGGLASCMTAGKVWIVVDLGGVYELSSIKIWNFQWQSSGTLPAGDLSNRGLSQFDVYVRNSVADTDTGLASGAAINLNNTSWSGYLNLCASFNLGTSNQWQLALENQALAQAPNTDTYAGQSYNFSGPKYGRFVAIVADTYYGGAGSGLGKVRLDGVSIPEPATIGILLLGSLMGLRCRRK